MLEMIYFLRIESILGSMLPSWTEKSEKKEARSTTCFLTLSLFRMRKSFS